MPIHSAGLLLYRRRRGGIEVLLVHPGGPYWRGKDEAAWSIPKGEFEVSEEALAAARREFAEETGLEAPEGPVMPLTPRRQPGGKTVHAFALEGDCDPSRLKSNSFAMEWPPKSGRTQSFPEVDEARWFALGAARGKVHRGQVAILDELAGLLARGPR